jgi:lipopolysaccharide heptosyltransferase I
MRILVVKPSSLGDVVHALPTVNLIRKKFPDAHIAWLINSELASLLKKCPVINEIIPFARHDYSKLPALARRLRQGRFDLVVDLQGLFRSGLMAWLTRAPRRVGLSDAREGSRMFYSEVVTVPRTHAVDRYLLAAKHLGCKTGRVEFPLGLESKISNPKSKIAINPCARWETKLWGDDNFSALLDHLPSNRVVLIGSRSERDRIAKINRDRARNLAGELDLYELAELYRQCAVVISNDTGPMHLAAAVGTPVIALFGPYGPGHVVIRSPTADVRAITVEQVLAAAKPFLV